MYVLVRLYKYGVYMSLVCKVLPYFEIVTVIVLKGYLFVMS